MNPNQQEFSEVRYSPPVGSLTVWLIRHGESEPLRPGDDRQLTAGQSDPPLTPLGRAQAEALALTLASQRLDRVYVSPLLRAVETGRSLSARQGVDLVTDADLKELHLGAWEGGLHRKYAREGDPAALSAIDRGDWSAIPGAESPVAFEKRVRRALRSVVASHPAGGRVAVVAHSGVIAMALGQASGASVETFSGADNCSVSEIVYDENGARIRRFNCLCSAQS